MERKVGDKRKIEKKKSKKPNRLAEALLMTET